MDVERFQAKWRNATLKERAAAQEHFIDLCRLVGAPPPAEADPDGDEFTFEKRVEKTVGGKGFADVWRRGYFAWEYKGRHANLRSAYLQLLEYREALENPPLLVVCDLHRIEIHTNFTGTPKTVYRIELDRLGDEESLRLLRAVFLQPSALRPETDGDAIEQAPRDLNDQIAAIRDRTLAMLDELGDRGRTYGLPEPPVAMATARVKVQEDAYIVAVVGEANRGKSTLVNALIGEPTVPTDVGIATSQVFLIQPAEVEAFRLRFEDESTRPIGRDELATFGSQAAVESRGVPRLDQILRWIEADVPIENLPPRISLLDTPGLGSLHAAHARITQRFIPYADAVIFVLDSNGPLGQLELDFIESILGTTRNIFFVQTKIDLHGREHWQTVKRRNEELLAEQFGDRLPDARVWPIASTLLLLATQHGDASLLRVSQTEEMMTALSSFLFRVVGASRAGRALLIAEEYHRTARVALVTRGAGLSERSARDEATLLARATAATNRFDAEWSTAGPKRGALMQALRDGNLNARQRFDGSLDEIEGRWRRAIDGIGSMDEAGRLGQELGDSVAAATVTAWRRLGAEARERSMALAQPFVDDVEALSKVLLGEGAVCDSLVLPELAAGWIREIRPVQAEGDDATTTLMREVIAVLALVGVVAPYVAVAGGAAAAAWTIARKYYVQRGARLEAARDELRDHLAEMMRDIRAYYMGDADSTTPGQVGAVDSLFETMVERMTNEFDAAAARKLEEVRAEMLSVVEQRAFEDLRRKEEMKRLEQWLAGWDDLGRQVQNLAVDIGAIGRTLTGWQTDPA